ALVAGDEPTAWRFVWTHPSFRGLGIGAVRAANLTLDDARLLVAREYSLEHWDALARFVGEVARDGPLARFEAAVESVIDGDYLALAGQLRAEPTLVRAQ